MRKLDSRLIVILILVAAGFLYFMMRPKSSSSEPSQGAVGAHGAVVNQSPQTISSSAQTQQISQDISGAEAVVPASSDSSAEPVQKLQAWMASEAKKLDQSHVDTKQKDLELKKRVENFSDIEKKFVLDSAHDIKKPANERILAAYMLVLDQSQSSLENLQSLASKALPDFGPVNAHSEAEIRRGQELAVRYMAIDELVKRASGNPEALETLKTIANSGESAEIRGYAQRMLKQIK